MEYNPWQDTIQRTGVYLCLSPCDGCKDPKGVMVGLAENIQACLRDFLAGTASMARKRHLASTARGFLMFLSYGLIGQLLHMALCCLEGSTLSNLVHRRRRCARISKHTILCLEGSTPEDRGGAFTRRGYRCGSRAAFLYCQRQLFCFLGA